jgi:ABC-type multidrug transport system fused ATPase/permease subunit
VIFIGPHGPPKLSRREKLRLPLIAFSSLPRALRLVWEAHPALDARAEYDIFRRFQELAADRTTILVSHRFSTVRMADRIIVLEGGRLIEQDTHAELLAVGGKYAHLFNLQTEGYR